MVKKKVKIINNSFPQIILVNDNISYCNNCYCMTKNIRRKDKIVCGKCGETKW